MDLSLKLIGDKIRRLMGRAGERPMSWPMIDAVETLREQEEAQEIPFPKDCDRPQEGADVSVEKRNSK